jgi:LytS/YehU family sensor histidine kinase
LTSLLRGVLRSDGEFTTLGRELDLIEHYLTIERERFEERLSVRIDVPAAVRDCRIPTLVLQPLVENAVKHGVSPSAAGGVVEITAALVETSTLCLTVRNSGAALAGAPAWPPGDHIGIDNVQRRLTGYFGEAAKFTLGVDGDGFTRAQIVMPFAVGAREGEDDFHVTVAASRTRG